MKKSHKTGKVSQNWKTLTQHATHEKNPTNGKSLTKLENAHNAVPGISFPNVCTAPPAHGKAFCHEHCKLLESRAPDVPTGLRDFLKYCGTQITSGGFECNVSLVNVCMHLYIHILLKVDFNCLHLYIILFR